MADLKKTFVAVLAHKFGQFLFTLKFIQKANEFRPHVVCRLHVHKSSICQGYYIFIQIVAYRIHLRDGIQAKMESSHPPATSWPHHHKCYPYPFQYWNLMLAGLSDCEHLHKSAHFH